MSSQIEQWRGVKVQKQTGAYENVEYNGSGVSNHKDCAVTTE